MSSNELKTVKNVQSADFQLVANTGFLAKAVPNFYLGVSQILGLTLVTAAGAGAGTAVVSNIAIANSAAVGPHGATITVASTVNTDASLYRLFWNNEYLANSAASYTN
jgi:hypothetical protein